MNRTIPIVLIQTATGYHAAAVTHGVPMGTLHQATGDAPGKAIDNCLETIINSGNGDAKFWIKGSIIPDPAQDQTDVKIAEVIE